MSQRKNNNNNKRAPHRGDSCRHEISLVVPAASAAARGVSTRANLATHRQRLRLLRNSLMRLSELQLPTCVADFVQISVKDFALFEEHSSVLQDCRRQRRRYSQQSDEAAPLLPSTIESIVRLAFPETPDVIQVPRSYAMVLDMVLTPGAEEVDMDSVVALAEARGIAEEQVGEVD